MKEEHLKAWLRAVTIEKYPDTETWDKVVIITQVAFREGYIPEALMWKILVLIPEVKGRGLDVENLGSYTGG